MRNIVLILLLCPILTVMAQEKAPSLYTKAPADWRAEVIPFPLDFAPEIPLVGVEELRFAPGMFKADTPDYFSYSFIWWLDGEVAINPAMLQKNLLPYFKGLYDAVSKKEVKKTDHFKVSITQTRERAWPGWAQHNFRGQAVWTDPFVTEKQLTLNLRAAQWYCTAQNKTAVYFALSPQPGDHALWSQLLAMEAGKCSP